MARRRRKKSDWKSTVRRDVLLSSRRANDRRSTFDDWRSYRPGFTTGRTPTSLWVRRTPSKPPLQIQVLKSGLDGNYPRVVLAPWAQSVSVVKRGALVCGRRQIRKEVLFANRIAGRNKRNSPGRGGTYKRTPESRITCT